MLGLGRAVIGEGNDAGAALLSPRELIRYRSGTSPFNRDPYGPFIRPPSFVEVLSLITLGALLAGLI